MTRIKSEQIKTGENDINKKEALQQEQNELRKEFTKLNQAKNTYQKWCKNPRTKGIINRQLEEDGSITKLEKLQSDLKVIQKEQLVIKDIIPKSKSNINQPSDFKSSTSKKSGGMG